MKRTVEVEVDTAPTWENADEYLIHIAELIQDRRSGGGDGPKLTVPEQAELVQCKAENDRLSAECNKLFAENDKLKRDLNTAQSGGNTAGLKMLHWGGGAALHCKPNCGQLNKSPVKVHIWVQNVSHAALVRDESPLLCSSCHGFEKWEPRQGEQVKLLPHGKHHGGAAVVKGRKSNDYWIVVPSGHGREELILKKYMRRLVGTSTEFAERNGKEPAAAH